MGYINSTIDDTSSCTGKTGPPGPAWSQGPPGAQMPRCPEDQKDHTAHRWCKGPKAIQAHGGFKDQKEIKGHRVSKVRQDHRGSKA